MLPGFRFLLAAIVLSTSILIFGLGAAALLRAAHDQFASNPYWNPAPDSTFAHRAEATRLVLAALRAETPADQQPSSNTGIVNGAPVFVFTQSEPSFASETATNSRIEQASLTLTPREDSVLQSNEAATSPSAVDDTELTTAQIPATPAPTEASIVESTSTVPPPSGSDERIVSVEQSSKQPAEASGSEIAPALTESHIGTPSGESTLTSLDAEIGSTIAVLDSPSTIVDTKPRAGITSLKADQIAMKKRLQARQAAIRRKIAARARQAKLAAQRAADPLAQPFTQSFPQPAAAR
ncbi:MAG: PspA/IM30 family protein [Bradyrhizobium sp.]